MIQSHLITPNFAESPGSGRIGVIKSYTTKKPLIPLFFFSFALGRRDPIFFPGLGWAGSTQIIFPKIRLSRVSLNWAREQRAGSIRNNRAKTSFLGEKGTVWENQYWLWLTASGAQRLRG